jgi:hypothetical protein
MKRPAGKIIPFRCRGVRPVPFTIKPQAIVTWPEGLSGAAVVYPIGESDVEIEQIRARLEKVLSDDSATAERPLRRDKKWKAKRGLL